MLNLKRLIIVLVFSAITLIPAFLDTDLYYISEIKNFLPPESNTPAYIYSAAVLSNGDMVVALPNRVAKIDSNGNYLTQIGKNGSDEGEYRVPWKVRTDSGGNIFLLDQMGKKILCYDSNGNFKNEIPFSEISNFNFIVTDEGKIVIPNSSKNVLSILSKDGKLIDEIHLKGNYLVSLSKGKGNTILVVETELSGTSLYYYIFRYNNRGNFLGKTRVNSKVNSIYPSSISESNSGFFYVIDSRTGSLFKISPDGKILWKKVKLPIPEKSNKLANMVDITFDYNDNALFISDGMHERILKFKEYEKIAESHSEYFYMREAEKYVDSDTDRFLCYMNLALLKNENNPSIIERLANFYHNHGFYKKSIAAWKKLLRLLPDNVTARRLLLKDQVLVYVKLGDRLSEIVRKLSREYGTSYTVKQYKDALDSYRKAYEISRDPKIALKIERLKKLYSQGKEEIPEIAIKKLLMEKNIFSAMYKYYSSHPVGEISIENTTGYTLDWLKIELNVREFMDYPTESEIKKNIPPGEKIKLKFYAVFNNKILDVIEDTPFSANIKVSYSIENKKYEMSRNVSFKLFNRNAMVWDDQRKLASFITPKDPAVKIFARETVQSFRNSRFKFLNSALQSAIQIFDTLGVYGITYIPDPKTPFVEYSKNPALVDYIQYPRETLRFKTGDCDDLTVLFSSLLQNIGIETATVTVPEHIFMMFDTGVSVSNKRSISTDSSLLFSYKGRVWIPVETTMLGDSFLEAWKAGASEIIKFRRKLGIATASDSWKVYAPVTLREEVWEPSIPEREYTERLYFDDIDNLINRELSNRVRRVRRQLELTPKNPRLYNKLGVIYARYGKYKRAEEAFKKAISLREDYFAPYNNLGNIYFLQKKYDIAINYYHKALAINPKIASVYINLAFIYKEENKKKEMAEAYNRAINLNKRLESEYSNYFVIGNAEKTGRAKGLFQAPDLLWDSEY